MSSPSTHCPWRNRAFPRSRHDGFLDDNPSSNDDADVVDREDPEEDDDVDDNGGGNRLLPPRTVSHTWFLWVRHLVTGDLGRVAG